MKQSSRKLLERVASLPIMDGVVRTRNQRPIIRNGLWESEPEVSVVSPVLPLLKWPGGKRYLIGHLKHLVPSIYGRYIEAFAGGAALFFALHPLRGLLVDTNAELINCYTQVRDRPADVINELAPMQNSKEEYYRIRSLRPAYPPARAARLIYLVTLSFNGIYRENRLGVFNVPYGQKTHLVPCDIEKILAASRALKYAEIRHGDFESAVRGAKADDVVYLDPPYTLAHENNGFIKYNARIFSWSDQIRLAKAARRLHNRGCRVIITNAAHASIAELYEGFTIVPIERRSVIAADGKHRKMVSEFIIHNKE